MISRSCSVKRQKREKKKKGLRSGSASQRLPHKAVVITTVTVAITTIAIEGAMSIGPISITQETAVKQRRAISTITGGIEKA